MRSLRNADRVAQPGGSRLASTTPPSRSASSVSVFLIGVLGMTMRPIVKPLGMHCSQINIRTMQLTGPRRLQQAKRLEERQERLDALRLPAHLHNNAVLAHVHDLPAKLLRERLDRLQVVALQPEGLARGERRRGLGLRGVLEVLREDGLALELGVYGLRLGLNLRLGLGLGLDAARLVRRAAEELLFQVLGAKNRDFGEEELALDAVRVRVVEYGPYGDLDR